MDQQVNFDPPAAPEDARKATEEQRKLQALTTRGSSTRTSKRK